MRLTRAALIAVVALAMAPAAAAADPIVNTTDVTPGPTTVTVQGTINPNGESLTYGVRWDLGDTIFCDGGGDTTQPSDLIPSPAPQLDASAPTQTVSVTITSLSPGHTYCAELIAENDFTPTAFEGGTKQFTESTVPPSIDGANFSPAGPTSESVTVNINPNGLDSSYVFGYDLNGSGWCASQGASGSPSQSITGSAGNGGADVSESATLASLSPGETYCWGVDATNSAGTTTSFGGTFLAGIPLATTLAATSVSNTAATLNAVVNPEANATNYTFDYAPSSDPFCSGEIGNPSVTGSFPVGAIDTNDHSVSVVVTGLAPATTYCFEAAAGNAANPVGVVTLGGLLTLTTAGNPLGGGGGPGASGGGPGASGGGPGARGGGSSGSGNQGTQAGAGGTSTPKPSCSIANASNAVILKQPKKGRPKTPIDSIVLTLRCSQTSSAILTGSFNAKVKHRNKTIRLPGRHLSLHARARKAVTIRLPRGALAIVSARTPLTAKLELTARNKGGTDTATRSFTLHG